MAHGRGPQSSGPLTCREQFSKTDIGNRLVKLMRDPTYFGSPQEPPK